jgi:outer membrane protein OmpA-like peptidoglycan-associated protein
LLVQILFGCASFKEEKPVEVETKEAPDTVSISVEDKAFSPNEDGKFDEATFKIVNKSPSTVPVVSWVLMINDSKNKTVLRKQSKNELPKKYEWDGKDNNLRMVADGKYSAALEVTFINGTSRTVKTDSFILDNTPPVIEMKRDLEYFSPDNDGLDDELTFTFTKAEDLTGIKDWELIITSPYSDTVFNSIGEKGTPKGDLVWDGKGKDGKLVESVEEYPVKLVSEDVVGNKGEVELDPILIDILVIKLKDGRYKIRVSSIKFKPNKAIMTADRKNIEILEKLTAALKRFGDHKILIEGFANRYATGLDEKKAYTLSKERAEVVLDKLNKRGIEKVRMTTKGKGFEDPIIPLKAGMTKEQKQEMAVNRRVEFYLEK